MNLTEYVCQVSLEDFGRAFRHQAYWNKRLRTTGGRFFPNDGHLDFNPRVLEGHGIKIFRQIVRHELCHYHLYYEQKGYRHRDADFKQLLRQVDGLRFVPKWPQPVTVKVYRCKSCNHLYRRKRQMNVQRYRCGLCQGRLLYQGQEVLES